MIRRFCEKVEGEGRKKGLLCIFFSYLLPYSASHVLTTSSISFSFLVA